MAWNLQEAMPYLSARDKRMAEAIKTIGSLVRQPMGGVFETLVQSILGQQVSIKAADTVWRRLTGSIGIVTPETLIALTPDALQTFGMSRRKASYILGAAEASITGQIDFDALDDLPDETCIQQLIQLQGVGRWTAEMLLIFSLQRQDVMSFGDYGIRSGLCKLYHHQDMPPERFRRYQKRFSPYGTAASLILWEVNARFD